MLGENANGKVERTNARSGGRVRPQAAPRSIVVPPVDRRVGRISRLALVAHRRRHRRYSDLAVLAVEIWVFAHGLLAGIVATSIYVGLNLGQNGTLTPAIEIYGLPLFVIVNGLRIVGSVAGAVASGRRAR